MQSRTGMLWSTIVEGILHRPGPWIDVAELTRYIERLHPVRRLLTLVLLVGTLAIPLLAAASAYQDYQQLRSLGQDAVGHLLAAKSDLLPSSGASATGGSSGCSGATPAPSPTPGTSSARAAGTGTGASGGFLLPDPARVAAAQHELRLAQQEFLALGNLLDAPNPTLSLAASLPSLQTKISSVRQLVYVGHDAATVGLSLTAAALPLLTRLHAGALANTADPLITTTEAAQIHTALVSSLGLLNDIQARVSQIQPSQLPVSACQRAEFEHLAGSLDEFKGLLAQAPSLFDMATWALGVDQPRKFLIQTMDRAELRPTGGFTGDFGVLTIKAGRVQPFTVRDANWVYNYTIGQTPPHVYSWWPFANFGLRDANVSPNFPTTARLILGLYRQYVAQAIGEPDTNIDGLIQFTVAPIQHILQVTGPVTVPDAGATVTANNVEQTIHYWQNDFAAINLQDAVCYVNPNSKTSTTRKCFSGELGRLLEQRVRQLSFSQLTLVAKALLNDMRSHEIQIYVTNPQIESQLLQQGYAQQLAASPGKDILVVNQANVSVSKASGYVQVSMQDDVALDAQGGATHHFTMSVTNDPSKDPTLAAYSYITTYRDYVRIYVPQSSQLQYANGFGTGELVCWVAPPYRQGEKKPAQFKNLPDCPSVMYGDGSLVCPPGYYGPGPNSTNGNGKVDWAVENTGDPTNYSSDIPGLSMFGGYLIVPELCTGVLTLTWYVPNVALPSSAVPPGAPAYTLLLPRQAGTNIHLTVHVQPVPSVPGEANAPVRFTGQFDGDLTFKVPRLAKRRT